MKKIAALLFLTACFLQLPAQDFLKVNGKKIINARGENVLLRGMGLGGWMLQEGYMLGINKEGQQYRIRERIDSLIGKEKTAAFYKIWLNNHTTKADIDSLKSWGFNSVRLPMHYNLYTLPIEEEKISNDQTWLQTGFDLTDSLVAWCKANEIYLILDLHAAPGGQGNDNNISDRDPSKPSLWESEANRQKTIALWKKLAEKYVNEPTIIAYDILNEPNWGFENLQHDKNGLTEKKNEPLEKLMREITAAIREADKNHIIIIEGNGWGNNYNGILDDGLWDNNMVLSFHKYWNFNDENSIAGIIKLRDQYNVPVWLGETGENSNVWFTQAIALLEKHNIGWAWWPLKKTGFNNPLQINISENYQRILSYWNGAIKKPLQIDFEKTLMDFAYSSNNAKNIFHPDVVDAMMRQPYSNSTKSYNTHWLENKLTIPATEYDLGKNNFAYYDLDTANYRVSGNAGVGNKGGVYRNDGVDIYKETSGYYVGSFQEEEWMMYTVDVEKEGIYNLTIRANSIKKTGQIAVLNLQTGISNVRSVATGSAETDWQTVEMKNVKMIKGKNELKVVAWEGTLNFKSIGFAKQL